MANNFRGPNFPGGGLVCTLVVQDATLPEKAKPGLEGSLKLWVAARGKKVVHASWMPAPRVRGGERREEGGERREPDRNTVFETTRNTWTTQAEAWNCEASEGC